MTKETFMKAKMEMGYTWFEALALWNDQNFKKTEKDSTEVYFDMLEEMYN